MKKLLALLSIRYEHILINAPLALEVTDASILTSMANIALVVVKAGRVPVVADQQL